MGKGGPKCDGGPGTKRLSGPQNGRPAITARCSDHNWTSHNDGNGRVTRKDHAAYSRARPKNGHVRQELTTFFSGYNSSHGFKTSQSVIVVVQPFRLLPSGHWSSFVRKNQTRFCSKQSQELWVIVWQCLSYLVGELLVEALGYSVALRQLEEARKQSHCVLHLHQPEHRDSQSKN